MMNFFTNNMTAKIIAFVLAIIVWAYVASGESRIVDLPSSIPIKVRSVGNGLIAKLNISEVNVKISVDKGMLKDLSADSFEAYIDLTAKTKGTYTDIPIIVVPKDRNISIRQIKPSSVTVTLDPAINKTVPVVVKIEGKPGEGLAPGDPVIEPDKVEVRGAKSDVDKILEATAIVTLKGETSDIKKTVPLVGLDSKGEEIKDLVFSPMEIVSTTPIVKAGRSKTVGIKVKTDGSVKSGYWASQITVEPNIVNITGNSDALNNTKYIETETINIDGLGANKTYTAELAPPVGIIMVDPVESVKITIVISSADTTKEIIASIESVNLTQTLNLNTTNSEPVKVVLSGPANKLDLLTSSDVKIILDLSVFHNPSVSTKVDISKDWIKVPDGISVVKFNPSAITISLESKSN